MSMSLHSWVGTGHSTRTSDSGSWATGGWTSRERRSRRGTDSVTTPRGVVRTIWSWHRSLAATSRRGGSGKGVASRGLGADVPRCSTSRATCASREPRRPSTHLHPFEQAAVDQVRGAAIPRSSRARLRRHGKRARSVRPPFPPLPRRVPWQRRRRGRRPRLRWPLLRASHVGRDRGPRLHRIQRVR